MYVSYVGKLFLQMLKALILPLIVPSLIAAVGSLDMSLSGKVGFDYLWNYFSIFNHTLFALFFRSEVGLWVITCPQRLLQSYSESYLYQRFILVDLVKRAMTILPKYAEKSQFCHFEGIL